MATRLEPYRDYSEHEVINMYSLKVEANDVLQTWKAGTSGKYDAGVVVTLGDSVLPGDLPGFAAAGSNLRSYLGADFTSGHVGVNAMPFVEMTVEAGDSTAPAIGITLKQTLAYDENDENLLRYPLKKDELQAVIPGQAVPILTRGLVLLGADAFETVPEAGDVITTCTAAAGKLDKDDGTGNQAVGRCIGTNDAAAPTKFLCKLSF